MMQIGKRGVLPTRPAGMANAYERRRRSSPTADVRGRKPLWGVVAAVLLSVLLNAAMRHWLLEAGMTLCIAGGVLAAPIVSLVAWLGLVLPERSMLHQSAPVLFAASLLWLALAIVGAHAHASRKPCASSTHEG